MVIPTGKSRGVTGTPGDSFICESSVTPCVHSLTNIDVLPAYLMCRAEAVEQDECKEQQWQHEVQIVEDQRAAEQKQKDSGHGAGDESREPGRDGSKGDGVDDNRRNRVPLQEPSSTVPLSLPPDGDGIQGDGVQRRKGVPDQQPPSPLHLQLQMFEAKEEASGPQHDEASVETETVSQDASWFQPTSGSTISLRGLTPLRVNWLTASAESTMNGHQTGTVGLAAGIRQLQGFRTNSDVIDRDESVVVAPWTPRGSSSGASFAVSSPRKTPRVRTRDVSLCCPPCELQGVFLRASMPIFSLQLLTPLAGPTPKPSATPCTDRSCQRRACCRQEQRPLELRSNE